MTASCGREQPVSWLSDLTILALRVVAVSLASLVSPARERLSAAATARRSPATRAGRTRPLSALAPLNLQLTVCNSLSGGEEADVKLGNHLTRPLKTHFTCYCSNAKGTSG